MSAYQYVGPTLAGNIGGGGSGQGFPFIGSAQITGSGADGGFAVTGSSTFDISGIQEMNLK